MKDSDGAEVFDVGEEEEKTDGPETWCRTQDRLLPAGIEQFVLNWLVMNSNLDDWEGGIRQALEVLVEKGVKQMSQSALVELSARNQEVPSRTGEISRTIIWTDMVDMGDVSAHQLSVGGLEFAVLDYGDSSHLPLTLQKKLNEGNTSGENQCSVIHLAAALEWNLQNRPNRFPLKTRVLHMAAEMRALEYERALNVWMCPKPGQGVEPLLQSLTHDILTANHDRDFRLWSLFNGVETNKHNVCVRVVELNSSSTRTRVYNYQPNDANTSEQNAIYLLAHRGHMRFMKPSRLTPETRWKNWRNEFNQVMDLLPITWGECSDATVMFGGWEDRQCRHCPERIWVKLTLPGMTSEIENAGTSRLAGKHPKRYVRTDAERREDNRRWTERYNAMKSVRGGIEEPVRSFSVSARQNPLGRTGVSEERDNRSDEAKHKNHSIVDTNLPIFFPPPRAVVVTSPDDATEEKIDHGNVLLKSDLEQTYWTSTATQYH